MTTPDGDEIETHTLWLTFPEGETAISLDLTRFNTAMRRLRAALDRRSSSRDDE